jgi:molybdate transport system substrate-binding protein
MKKFSKTLLVLACFVSTVIMAAPAAAAGVVVTTGAGYKTTLEELSKAFRESGGTIEEMYGGAIGQMLAQIRQGSGVNVVVSDKAALNAASQGVEFDSFEDLGETPLVLAWRKGITIESPKDLEKAEVKSVCHPDTQAAIYGRAASQFLESSGIGKNIAAKLSVISTVPQVFAYLSSGEMDAGFVNRVMILNGSDKLGGWLEIREGYPPISMVAAVVKGHGDDPQVAKFLEFLRGEKGKAILKKNGIW